MDIKNLNNELANAIEEMKMFNEEQINELRAEDAGEEITDFKDYNDALDKIKARYDNNEILAYCPNATTFDYDGKTYQLAVVLGIKEPNETKGSMNPHGMAHYLNKHTYTNDTKTEPTQEDLIKAAKNIKGAYGVAKKKKQIAFDPFENKVIFSNGKYVYIVCLAKDEVELSYLHNLFQLEKPNYIQNQKKQIQKKLKNELPPNRTKEQS